jgi:hypothetical protein
MIFKGVAFKRKPLCIDVGKEKKKSGFHLVGYHIPLGLAFNGVSFFKKKIIKHEKLKKIGPRLGVHPCESPHPCLSFHSLVLVANTVSLYQTVQGSHKVLIGTKTYCFF